MPARIVVHARRVGQRSRGVKKRRSRTQTQAVRYRCEATKPRRSAVGRTSNEAFSVRQYANGKARKAVCTANVRRSTGLMPSSRRSLPPKEWASGQASKCVGLRVGAATGNLLELVDFVRGQSPRSVTPQACHFWSMPVFSTPLMRLPWDLPAYAIKEFNPLSEEGGRHTLMKLS